MTTRFPNKGYRRHTRVGDAVQQIVAEGVERLLDKPELGLITVTRVQAAPDLRTARVFVSALGGSETSGDKLVAALEAIGGELQREIGRHLRIKRTPRLTFVADELPARAARIDELIHDMPATPDDQVAPDTHAPLPETDPAP